MPRSAESKSLKYLGLPLVLSVALAPVAGAPAFADTQEPSPEEHTEAPTDVAAEDEDLDYVAPESDVLISEVANGGPGGHIENFIEITNYGDEPQDIGGWYIYRCGQSGDSYGPQDIIPEGTVLDPGEQYTTVREGSSYEGADFADSTYDVSLHPFGFGALLRDADHQPVDRIAFYHSYMEQSECRNPDTLQHQVSWAHGQSHQRVSRTGDISEDWIVAESTPGAENNTEWQDITADRSEVGDVVISEFAPGGPGGYNDDFIEIANAGEEPVDVSGWQVWRCGDNSQTYVQSDGLPEGTVLDPGEVFVLAHESADTPADLRYPTSVHWINSGAMVLTPDAQMVDRMSMYSNRVSPCTDGEAKAMDLQAIHGESYQRISDTGNNADDFVAAARTPGSWPAEEELEPVEIAESAQAGAVEVTEIIANGPAGGNDEFVELTNLSDAPVDMSGWQLYRCEDTGRMAGTPQVEDLEVTLQPGETYVATHQNAPGELVDLAEHTYSVGMNWEDGYGAVVFDGDGGRVDGVGVYDTIPAEHCGNGLTLQNNTHSDEGISYQRARSTGVSYDDFIKADRTPGEYVDHEWRDEASPRPGQTDPAEVDRSYRPGTPVVEADGAEPTESDEFITSVRTEHQGSSEVDVSFRSAEPVVLDEGSTQIFAGTTSEVPPSTLEIEGEQVLSPDDELVSEGSNGERPFQRYQITVDEVPEEGLELVWTGQTQDRNELQMYGWDYAEQEWLLLEAAVPSEDGDISLVSRIPSAMVEDTAANVLILDGPRTQGGLLEEVGITDESFAEPGSYDFAINHMTDTQFYSEGFVSVFMDMVAWVIANHESRNIAYSVNTGDIIENWMRGFDDPERAHREFRDATQITQHLNDAGVANGVLPGNHDNWWGRNNEMYNEYFGPEMFEEHPWWGNSWQPGDNSAHYDFFTHEGVKFLVINLQYNPSDAQMQWASDVAAANPEWNVVLATHSYLYTDGEHEDIDRRHSARGRELWEEVVAPNDNIFLVLGGHYHGVATNYADPVTGEQTDVTEVGDTVVVDNVGADGRRVVEMLADYQGYRSTQPEPRDDTHDRDTGFQRLLQFDLDAGLMAVNAYSPTLDAFDAWRYDEPDFRGENARYGPEDDEFVVQVSLNRPTAFTTQAWTVQGTASEEALVTVPAGEVAEHQWDAEDAGLNWYAVVSGTGAVEQGTAAEAAERAPAGSLLEHLLEDQIVRSAEQDAYPAGEVQRPLREETSEEPGETEGSGVEESGTEESGTEESGAEESGETDESGAEGSGTEESEDAASSDVAPQSAGAGALGMSVLPSTTQPAEPAEDQDEDGSAEEEPAEGESGTADEEDATSEDDAAPEDAESGASEEEAGLGEDEEAVTDEDEVLEDDEAAQNDEAVQEDEEAVEDEAAEEAQEPIVRQLNEPAEVTGPSVATLPRQLGEVTDPGVPGDPGLPEEPGEPEDPGQPEVPGDDTPPDLPVPPEEEEPPGTDPEDEAPEDEDEAPAPDDEGDLPQVPGVEQPEGTEDGSSGEDESGSQDGGAGEDGAADGSGEGGQAADAGKGGSSGGWLAQTGAQVGTIAAAALLLLLIGTAVVMVARRRRAGAASDS